MLWGLWFLAIAIFVGIWLLYWFEDGRGHGAANEYRQKFVRLIDRVEVVVGMANRLESPARTVGDVRILDSYLSHLRMLESLMSAVRTMDAFGTAPSTLQAPLFLANDIQERFKRLESEVSARSRGKFKSIELEQSHHLGCYFCSRPFDPILFHKVRVKVDNKAAEVTACKTCKQRLTAGLKARVLFFDEDGKAVHWSKAKGYVPTERYWTINADEPAAALTQNTGTHLTLVHSSASPLSSLSKFE